MHSQSQDNSRLDWVISCGIQGLLKLPFLRLFHNVHVMLHQACSEFNTKACVQENGWHFNLGNKEMLCLPSKLSRFELLSR